MPYQADFTLTTAAIPDMDSPTPLYSRHGTAIYWLGITDETAFRCNTYLIVDGDQALLVDPGNRSFFDQVKTRVSQIMLPEYVSGLIVCHQDPDVAASMVDWLELNPEMPVYSSPRTHVLLPHYGNPDYNAYDIVANPEFTLPSGSHLRFIEAPFLHFPGAFVTYHSESGFLFSGDIWAALDTDWSLAVSSFGIHKEKMDLFHLDYMASNLATRGFIKSLSGFEIQAILPQHGSIIGTSHVDDAIEYLKELRCGTDLIYPEIP
ncbi:MAG: MBL fold metallo-hydrolase [Candidatus Thiodiazotropha endolucinida]